MPSVTVFSVNPETGEPYMTLKGATKLAATHIRRYGVNLLRWYDIEDLIQELLLRLCIAKYDPTLSAPMTFMIMCFSSKLGQLANARKNNNRYLEVSDIQLNETQMLSEVYGECNITPEDVLQACDQVSEYQQTEKRPEGWRGFRKLRSNSIPDGEV